MVMVITLLSPRTINLKPSPTNPELDSSRQHDLGFRDTIKCVIFYFRFDTSEK